MALQITPNEAKRLERHLKDDLRKLLENLPGFRHQRLARNVTKKTIIDNIRRIANSHVGSNMVVRGVLLHGIKQAPGPHTSHHHHRQPGRASIPTNIGHYHHHHTHGGSGGRSRGHHSASGAPAVPQRGVPYPHFRENAFYEHIKELSIPQRINSWQRTVDFMYTEDMNLLQKDVRVLLRGTWTKNREGVVDIRPDQKITDRFPRQVTMRVNDQRYWEYPERTYANHAPFTKPMDITKYVRYKNNQITMILEAKESVENEYVMMVELVRRRPVEKLIQRLQERRMVSKEQTLAFIAKRHGNDTEDEDMLECKEIISLKCPIMFTRIKLPARGKECNHLGCFDATNYLMMNENRPTWNCPLCHKIVTYSDMVVCMWTMDVLKNTRDTIGSVEVAKDGTWNIKDEDVTDSEDEDDHDGGDKAKDEAPVFELLDDDEDAPTTQQREQQQQQQNNAPGNGTVIQNGGAGHKRKADSHDQTASAPKRPSSAPGSTTKRRSEPEVVDLTLDSSDDEDAQPPPPRHRPRTSDRGLPIHDSIPGSGLNMSTMGELRQPDQRGPTNRSPARRMTTPADVGLNRMYHAAPSGGNDSNGQQWTSSTANAMLYHAAPNHQHAPGYRNRTTSTDSVGSRGSAAGSGSGSYPTAATGSSNTPNSSTGGATSTGTFLGSTAFPTQPIPGMNDMYFGQAPRFSSRTSTGAVTETGVFGMNSGGSGGGSVGGVPPNAGVLNPRSSGGAPSASNGPGTLDDISFSSLLSDANLAPQASETTLDSLLGPGDPARPANP
eukprot:Clim_evm29s201 gene=Clim_evmTU29s201